MDWNAVARLLKTWRRPTTRRRSSRPTCPLRLELLEQRTVPDTTFGTLLTTEHVDVGLAFEDGAWDLHLHDETNDVEYGPGEALLHASAAARVTVPPGSQFAFLGAAPGDTVW